MNGVSGAGADEWGSLKGQVVVTGDLPDLPLLVTKGNLQTGDAAVCAAMDVPDESLLVEPRGRGLANVFVYLKDPPRRIHPNGQKPPGAEAVLMVQNCRYFPHAFVIRAGQTLQVRFQQGEVAHNVTPGSMANPRVGFRLDADLYRFEFPRPDRLPMPIRCDIHPWMRANFLVVDHPYAAVTDANGRFEIKDLPTGEQTFRVWHERPGYIAREWKVTIGADKTIEAPVIEVSGERLEDRSRRPAVSPATPK